MCMYMYMYVYNQDTCMQVERRLASHKLTHATAITVVTFWLGEQTLVFGTSMCVFAY